jgi:hypothetical protein
MEKSNPCPRSDYVKCIASTHADKIGRSLCERLIGSATTEANCALLSLFSRVSITGTITA